MLNLLSKINMSIFGSKLASLSPLMLNTVESADVAGMAASGLGSLLDIIIDFLVKCVYTVCAFAMNIIDFFQYVINKIIGLGGDYVVFDTSNPLMKFLLNPTVWEVFTYVCGLAIILLIVFTIYAIIRSEYQFATGKAGDNNKARIFGRSLRSLFSLMMFPIILFGSIILLNAVLFGFNNVFVEASGEGTVSLGGQIFAASSYNANRYRNFANRNVRIPLFVDFDDPIQNGTASGYESEELADIYRKFNDLGGGDLYSMFMHETFPTWNDTIVYKGNKMYNTAEYSKKYDSFVATPDQYYVMADFTDYAVKKGLTYTYKSVKDDDINWKYVDDAVFNEETLTLSITYRDAANISGSESYVMQITPTSTDISTPLQDAIKTISTMLAIGNYEDDTFNILSRNEDFINYIEWDTRKVILRLSPGCQLNSPDTWTVSDSIILYEWSRYDYNNTIPSYVTFEELKEGIEINAQILTKRKYSTTTSKYIVTDEYDVAVINNNFYRIIESKDITVDKNLDEHGFPYYQLLGYDVDNESSDPDVLYERNILSGIQSYINGYINVNTRNPIETTDSVKSFTYNDREYHILKAEFHSLNSGIDLAGYNWDIYGLNEVRRLTLTNGRYYYVGTDVEVTENKAVAVDGYYYYAPDVIENTKTNIEKGYYIVKGTNEIILMGDAIEIRGTSNLVYCSEESFKDVKVTKLNGTQEYIDPSNGDKYYNFYDDLLSDNIKTVSWPEKLISDLQVIYKDINLELLISNGTWLKKLSELSSNYFASDAGLNPHAAFSSSLIHPLGMVLSELMLGMIEEANPYFDYGDLVFSPKYDQETINGLLLALLGEEKYYQAKQELSALIEIYNAYFMTMLSEIAYTENFDLKVGKEASVQLFTYKAYLASILLSDDCANYFANLALKVVGSNNFIDKITGACPSDCVNKDKDVCNTHRGYKNWDKTIQVSGVSLEAMKKDLMVMFKDAFDNETFAQFFAYANQYKPEYDKNGNPTGTYIVPTSQELFNVRKALILAADSVTSIDDLSTRVGTLKSVQDQLDFFEDGGMYDSEMRELAYEIAEKYLNNPRQFAMRYLINLRPETVGTTDDFIKNIKAYVISDITGSYEEDAAHNIVFKGNYEFLNTVSLDDFATYLEREKVYGGIDAVNNWVILRKKTNDVKKLLDIANTMIKEGSQYSFLDNFNGTFTALRLAFQPIGDFVETQSLSDSLSKYYISYSVKLYFEELTKDTSFTISVRNKQYKVGEHFVKAKLAEYVLGADYLKSIGYDTVFVDSDYKGMIQFEYDYANGKYTDTVKSSFVCIREFLSEFAQISVDLYTTTNFAPLMVNSVDNVKFVKNPNLANYVVKYINDLELLDISTRIRFDICENGGTFKMIASPEAALNRLQSVMEYLLNTSGSVEHFDYVDYRELSLKELRIKCLNYLEDYKQPEGISGAESQAAYLTTFYLTTANWIVQNGSTANLKNWHTKENGEAKDPIIGLSSKMQNSQSIGTLLRLCGIESRPIEELVGLEYTIDFNYHGVDEQYGDVFVLCTFNPNTRQYLPILATPKANMERFIESDLNPFRTDTEPSGKKVLPAGDEEYLTIMRTNKVDMNGLAAEAEGLESAYPIIARGVIDEYGCPTAIKIQNGDVHFYREDLYMINTSNFGISQYFVSTEAANESGNPISWIVNTFSRIFTGKSLAEHIISSTPRIRLDSYIGYAIGVQTNTTDVVRNSECHLDYNFNEYIADTIPLHVLYDLNEINIIILICSIGLLFGMLFKAFWGLISRMFNLTLYFLMGPLMISTIAQKYEQKKGEETAVAYDKWKESLISELLSVFSYVFAINLYFILATMVDSFDMFADNSAFAKLPLFSLISVDFLNEIARVVFLLGLAGIFSSLPKIFNSILGVKDIFEQGANTKAAVDNTVAAVQDFASGQEIMDKIDTIKEPFEDIINKRKQKEAAKMAAAAAIIAGADPKAAVEAGKALEDKMKEHAERDKILRHERQYIRDKRNDAIMGTDESEGDAEERRLAHHNYELAPKAKDLRKKMAEDKEDAKKEKKAKAKAEKEGKAYTAPTKYDKQRAELEQELIDIDKNATFGSGLADAVRKKEIREELENIEKQIQKDAKAQAKYVKKNSNKFEKASTQVNTEDLSKTEKKIFKAVEKLKADDKDKK